MSLPPGSRRRCCGFPADGVRAGRGDYTAELLACQTSVDELSWQRHAVQYPDLTFIDGSEWHQGKPVDELRIGGKLAMLDAARA